MTLPPHPDLREYMAYASGQRKKYGNASIQFDIAWVENKRKSVEEGRVVMEPHEVLHIDFPGQGRKTVEVTEGHRTGEYAEHYRAWKEGRETPPVGFPLGQWPQMSRADLDALVAEGFQTVEQLAEAPDVTKNKLGSLGVWVKRAKEFLASSKEGAGAIVALKEQIERQDATIKKQQEQIILLMQRIEAETGTRLLTPEMLAAHNAQMLSVKTSPTPEASVKKSKKTEKNEGVTA